jgi:cellulose synthase/poly-beta-1,6-N-acetylglucosamine synthase-like glycosyltransferase
MGPGDWILLALAALLAIPFVFLAVEAIASLLPPRRSPLAAERPACVVLMPAHNEAGIITRTIRNVQGQLAPGDRLLVIADNCSDETAAEARAAGADVIERSDPDRRGKGYALDYGLNHLAADPPPVIAVVDADCDLAPGALDAVVRQAFATDRPAQGIYLIGTGREADVPRRLSAFAVQFKNQIRPLGLHQLGLPCLLNGTGMAFPWRVIRAARLNTGSIVEDTLLGVDLALQGHPAQLCPTAFLTGAAAPDRAAAAKQRTRWEHGHVQTILDWVPALLRTGLVKGRPTLIGLGMELGIPPLSLLILAWVVLTTVCLLWWQLANGSWAPALILASAALLTGLAVLMAWRKFGRKTMPLFTLVTAPLYIAWKLPIYLRLVTGREKSWVRTDRGRLSDSGTA